MVIVDHNKSCANGFIIFCLKLIIRVMISNIVFISVKVESTFNAFLSTVLCHYLMSIFYDP
jgi:hypothetical protein